MCPPGYWVFAMQDTTGGQPQEFQDHRQGRRPVTTKFDGMWATQQPTAFMMMTKFAAVLVIKVGAQRQLARPLSTVQQQYLRALGVPATYFTVPQRGYRTELGQSRSQQSPG